MRRWISMLLCLCLLGGMLTACSALKGEGGAFERNFTFSDGQMTKEVLRSYCSRAVTLAGFCVENNAADPIFEEDLRMLCRIGAKYVGRAAYYSWGGHMSWDQIQEHYRVAKERATLAHEADPEMILQAGVFEILFSGTAGATPIPTS